MGFDFDPGKIVTSLPLIGGMFDNTDKLAMEQLAKNQALYNNIALPDLKWQDYNPETYTTQDAQYQTISEDPMVRSAQLAALSKMAGLANTGLSDEDAAAFQKARAQGNQMSKAGTEAALANAQARGVGGSGLEFAMREAANQQGAERAQSAGLEQAATAARQRALYNQAYAQGMGSMRTQDMNANQANADIINRFNQANTAQRNSANFANVDMRNQAQMTNNQGKRDVAQQNFNNQLQRAGGQAQANTGMAGGYAAQNAANTAERNRMTDIAMQIAMSGAGGGGGKKMAGQSNKDYSGYA
jgi:hypothetical protein